MTNNQQVAEAFASKRSAKGLHIFSEGHTIYSYGYHFPIAHWTGKYSPDGREIVLFTSRGYSVTTSAHKAKVRNALFGIGCYVIETHDVERISDESYRELEDRAKEAKEKSKRARSDWKRDHWEKEALIAKKDLSVLKAVKFENGERKEQPDITRQVAAIAKLGEVFVQTTKARNDWKKRILKAGLENQGLEFPDDWDSLSEETKQARLDGAIDVIIK